MARRLRAAAVRFGEAHDLAGGRFDAPQDFTAAP